MAETFISAFVETIFQRLGSLVLQEIGTTWGVEAELQKIENTLSTLKAVLLDAEKQQASTHNYEVRIWLETIEDVVYDADDVLDEFTTEYLRRQVEVHGSIKNKVRDFFSRSNPLAFRFKMGHKLKKIRYRLFEIAASKRQFNFRELDFDTRFGTRVREETHSLVLQSDVVGRDADKGRIVQLLVTGPSDGDEHISVIPIVGIGGLGKTTLAKLVFNDERVIIQFDIRMWVCVSDDFDLKMLIEKMVVSATGSDCGDLIFDELQIQLQSALGTKKCFLVLDDVWNEDSDKWGQLRNLLMCCARGSKILVTTRSEMVASIMGTGEPYHLKVLQEGDCWSLFTHCAFRQGEEHMRPELIEIGKEIVKKCRGVPLAVKTLGRMLFMQTGVDNWMAVKDSDIWKLPQREGDIMSILRLSYDVMPSSLKQCFAYCSIFPKDYELLREELIGLWIAQGYIQSIDGSRQELEEIGNQYFYELVSRSFFQDVYEAFDSQVISCKMHDLLHDLALSVGGFRWLIADSNTTRFTRESVRHILFSETGFEGKEFPSDLLKFNKVRSLNFLFDGAALSISFIEMLTMNFNRLRVLDFSGAEFEELPSSIGNLKQLRYLRLYNNYTIKVLSNSICKLLNLQFLDLYRCEQLKELPKDIGNLINLRKLDLTSQQSCLPEKGLQGWISLRFLRLHRCQNLTFLSEGIQHLTALRDLRIGECPMIASLPSSMKYLTSLERLGIYDCEGLTSLHEDEECMSNLRCLRSLSIDGLPRLLALPPGIRKLASSLQYFEIKSCRDLKTLPEWLKDLTSLQVLYIEYCPNVWSLPDGMHCLTALRKLSVAGSLHLSKRCRAEGDDWPKISHVREILL